ncbi:hypothetical protein GPALN_006640 [Globodera pallida]|nr:hypothetical protein GPALN_006640 [Globodera pallida]
MENGTKIFGKKAVQNLPVSMPCRRQTAHPIVLIISAVFVFWRFVSANQQCVRNCSNAFRLSLGSILDKGGHHPNAPVVLSPLHSLILNSPNNFVVQRRTEWICNSIDKFKQCIKNCEENRLKLVELANVGHWEVVCRTLFVHPKTFSEFISCQRKHLAEVGQRCRPPILTVDEGRKLLGHFCRQMNAYAKCYRRTAQKCTKNASMVSHRLSEAIEHSFARIQQIARGHLHIPEQCHRSVDSFSLATSTGGSDEDGDGRLRASPSTDGVKEHDYWLDGGGNGEEAASNVRFLQARNRGGVGTQKLIKEGLANALNFCAMEIVMGLSMQLLMKSAVLYRDQENSQNVKKREENHSILFWRFVSANQQCVRNCSNAFRLSLGSILDKGGHHPNAPVVLSPLHSLILNSPNNFVVQRRTEWICNCEENRLKLVELANVGHWEVVCRTLFVHPKTFSEFISCQRKHLAEVGQRCRPPIPTVDEGRKLLGHFCRQMNAYAKCYRRTAQKCTKNRVSLRLSEAIGHSFARIQQIARGHLHIPEQCHRSVDSFSLATSTGGSGEDGDGRLRASPSADGANEHDYWLDGGGNGEEAASNVRFLQARNRGGLWAYPSSGPPCGSAPTESAMVEPRHRSPASVIAGTPQPGEANVRWGAKGERM